jgi:hypothetical protein
VVREIDADAPEHPACHLARAPNEGRAEKRVEDDDGAGYEVDCRRVCARKLDARKKHEQGPDQRGKADRDRNAHGSLAADKARHEAIEPKLEEGCHTNRRRRGEDEKQLPGGRHVGLAQPQRHGQPEGEAQQKEIGRGEDGALGIAAEADQAQQHLAHQCLESRPRVEIGHRINHQSFVDHRRLGQQARGQLCSNFEFTCSTVDAASPCPRS